MQKELRNIQNTQPKTKTKKTNVVEDNDDYDDELQD
jgi:hypothetical protein